MERLQKLKIIFEKELVRTLEDQELNNTWEELDLDSLSMISVLRDVEDEFKIVLEYNIFKDHKINCINDLDKYLNTIL
jgi:acyl carrier protein